MKNEGLPDDLFDGHPIIGICNTWSELAYNAFRGIAERVNAASRKPTAFPWNFPSPLPVSNHTPTNSSAISSAWTGGTIEAINRRVVLLCGCDKTTPAL
jgi:hypothetical protein